MPSFASLTVLHRVDGKHARLASQRKQSCIGWQVGLAAAPLWDSFGGASTNAIASATAQHPR